VTVTASLLGGSPAATFKEKVRKATWRAGRTLLQGIVGAFPAAGPASTVVDATYWRTWWASVLVAMTAALVSFMQNVVSAIPDPGQD
jgi:hypothetical protein